MIMKQNAVYIVPNSPIFNTSRIQLFDKFNINESIFLRSTLYLNLINNFLNKEDKTDFYFYLDELDKDFLPEEFKQQNFTLHFFDLTNKKLFFENLSFKEFKQHKNNILISSDIIGINIFDIDKYINLLSIEDESLLIGKSKENEIGVLGFNNYYPDIFDNFTKSYFMFDDFLSRIKSSNHFITTLNDIILIRNINDFKQLYHELSQKKSIEYCSQEMHERFTHLFIEYKDLLK